MSEAVQTASSSVEATGIETPEAPVQQAAPDFRGTKHKLKVNQKDLELDYDEVIARAQKAEAADERFKEASTLRRETEERRKEIEAFEKDPWGYLKGKGTDPYELAESLLLERIKYEQMSDEQREALAAKMEAAELRKYKEEHEGKEKAKRDAELSEKAVQSIDQDIGDALKSLGRKPTPRLVARIAETMLAHMTKSEGEVSAKNVIGSVQKEYQADIHEYLSNLTPDQLREVLPRNLLDGLRKADVEKAMSQDPTRSRRRVVSTDGTVKEAPRKRLSWDDAFKEKEKQFGRS